MLPRPHKHLFGSLYILPSIALLGALAAFSAAPLPGSEPIAAASSEDLASEAAVAAPASNVEAVLYDNTIAWTTSPGTVVRAQLREGDTVRANGPNRIADESGRVQLPLGGGGGPGGRPGGGGGGAAIMPGYTIVLLPTGGEELTVDVPAMAAGIDIDGDRVLGSAPAGAVLEISVPPAGEPGATTTTVSAGADGSFEATGLGDLEPGDAASVAMTDGAANTFSVYAVAVQASVTLGNPRMTGDATPGDTVRLSVVDATGSSRGPYETTVTGGTDWALPGGGGGGGPTSALAPLVAGETVTLEHVSAVPGASRTIVATLSAVEITAVGGGRVSGTAEPGAPIRVEAIAPGGDVTTADTIAAEDGTWSADIGGASLGPGWRIRVGQTPVPGLTIYAVQAIEQVRVGVHRSRVEGVANPGSSVTVTLLTSEATVRTTTTTTANGQGFFNVDFGGANTIEFGDIVQVDFVAGDPVIVPVDEISARTDWLNDRISGAAPAGTTVTVRQGAGASAVTRTTAVDESGYSIDFSAGEAVDIEPPMSGEVSVRLLNGHELYTYWSAVRMTVEVGDDFLSGNGPNFRVARADLLDPDGTLVASGSDAVGGGGGGGFGGGGVGGGGGTGGNWFIDFADDTGTPVNVRPGDVVRATIGDDVFELVVPELRGVAFVTDDTINGRTAAERDVRIQVNRPLTPEGAVATVRSDGEGNFSHAFVADEEGEGAFDLQHNDAILLQIQEQGHNVNSQLFVPGLTIDLDLALLTGWWRPSTEVDVALVRGVDIRASHRVPTAEDATFNVILRDATGARTLPAAGDRLIVQPLDDPGADALELVIPELTIGGDEEADSVAGTAAPGGLLTVLLRDGIDRTFRGPGGGGPGGGGPGGVGQRAAQPEVGEDGTWAIPSFTPALDVRAGTRMQAIYREPSGHRALRLRYIPMLNVQHGGSTVCGFAEPLSDVEASVTDPDGAPAGNATGSAGYDSTFTMRLESDGEAAFTAAGQTARGDLGGTDIEAVLPELSVSIDWDADQITGTAPPGTLVLLSRPARICLDQQPRNITGVRTNGEGRFQVNNLPGPTRDPGEGIEIAIYDQRGDRVYRHIFRSLGQVYVHTDRVLGRGTPNAPVEVIVLSAEGVERGRAGTFADDGGRFAVEVLDGDGSSVEILPGETVRLEASGETVDIPVEELAFDWSPGAGSAVVGRAVPGRAVAIRLVLEDGRVMDATRVADESGAFRYGSADVPPRADWSMADVRGVIAVVTLSNGHQVVAATGDIGDVTPIEPPASRTRTIFLPFGVR